MNTLVLRKCHYRCEQYRYHALPTYLIIFNICVLATTVFEQYAICVSCLKIIKQEINKVVKPLQFFFKIGS